MNRATAADLVPEPEVVPFLLRSMSFWKIFEFQRKRGSLFVGAIPQCFPNQPTVSFPAPASAVGLHLKLFQCQRSFLPTRRMAFK